MHVNTAERICARLRDAGYQALFNGGCVRDIILGREPSDYDVCTDATPERVQQLFPDSIPVGAQFGVVIVVEDGVQVEVATFRSDIGSSDGRHPVRVEFSSSPEEDVRRRDFTINGLLMDPRDEQILDFVGGQADIKARIVRAIGEPELRFEEDKLRMLRAVRFAARFGYSIEPRTFAAIRKLASQIQQVSQERVRDELSKMLTEGAARRAFELLDETGLLREVLPEIARMKGVEQPPQFHPEGDVWTHTLLMIEKLPAAQRGRSRGAFCCTMLANRRRSKRHPVQTIGYGSTSTWKLACASRRTFAGGCAFPTKTRSKLRRWWRIICGSRMCRTCATRLASASRGSRISNSILNCIGSIAFRATGAFRAMTSSKASSPRLRLKQSARRGF